MISSGDIYTKVHDDVDMPYLHVAASLNVHAQRYLERQFVDIASEGECRRQVSRDVWDHVYGDIERQLNEIAHMVHGLESRVGDISEKTTRKILGLLRQVQFDGALEVERRE